MLRPLVIIESPYAGDVETNMLYLKACIHDSLYRGETPFASHGFYTQYLDDSSPRQRDLGIKMGEQWREKADYTVFYIDKGMSPGMESAHRICMNRGLKFEVRCLHGRS